MNTACRNILRERSNLFPLCCWFSLRLSDEVISPVSRLFIMCQGPSEVRDTWVMNMDSHERFILAGTLGFSSTTAFLTESQGNSPTQIAWAMAFYKPVRKGSDDWCIWTAQTNKIFCFPVWQTESQFFLYWTVINLLFTLLMAWRLLCACAHIINLHSWILIGWQH